MELRTKQEAITALGGIRAVATLTGASYGAVENWRRRKRIPPEFHNKMQSALRKLGHTAPGSLWGMRDGD